MKKIKQNKWNFSFKDEKAWIIIGGAAIIIGLLGKVLLTLGIITILISMFALWNKRKSQSLIKEKNKSEEKT